jgi:hypothetical protein
MRAKASAAFPILPLCVCLETLSGVIGLVEERGVSFVKTVTITKVNMNIGSPPQQRLQLYQVYFVVQLLMASHQMMAMVTMLTAKIHSTTEILHRLDRPHRPHHPHHHQT